MSEDLESFNPNERKSVLSLRRNFQKLHEGAESEKIEVSVFPKSGFFLSFSLHFTELIEYVVREKSNTVFLRAGKICCAFYILFLILLFVVFRFVYHLLSNIIVQFIYLVYDYTNINLTAFGQLFRRPDLRNDIRKKIALDDNWNPFWFLYHLNYLIKRYHFFIINAVMLGYTARYREFFLSLDINAGRNINSQLFTFLQVVVGALIGYLNFRRTYKIRTDLTSFVRSLTKGHFRVIDSNSTVLKSLEEILADLTFYSFVHLRTDDEDDILLSSRSYKEFNVGELRELMQDGVIFNGKRFRFLFISPDDLQLQEDVSLHVYYYHYFSICPTWVFNVTINDLRVYDTLTVFVLFLYFFTSLNLKGKFYLLYMLLVLFFVFLLIIRRQEERIFSFGFYENHQLKKIRNKSNFRLNQMDEGSTPTAPDESTLRNISTILQSDFVNRDTDYQKENYFNNISKLECFQSLKSALTDHHYKLCTSNSINKDEIDRKVTGFLIHCVLKSCYRSSYRFDLLGFRVEDFIKIVKEVSLFHTFAITLQYDGSLEYYYAREKAVHLININLHKDGRTSDVSIEENKLKDKRGGKRFNFHLEIELPVLSYYVK